MPRGGYASHAPGRTVVRGPENATTSGCAMEIPSNDSVTSAAERALSVLAENTEDDAALDTLAATDVLVPVPDDTDDEAVADPTVVALPVLEQDGEEPLVPVFTSE